MHKFLMLPLWRAVIQHVPFVNAPIRAYPKIRHPLFPWIVRNGFSTTPVHLKSNRALPPKPMWLIKEDELEEKFVKGGGPGGQKVNKCNSKAQITHIPTGIVVESQYSRSQKKNRVRAREILAMRLEQLENPENCRLATIAQRKAKLKANRAKKAAKKKLQQEKKEQRAEAKKKRHEEFVAESIAQKNSKKMVGTEPVFDIEHEIDELLSASHTRPHPRETNHKNRPSGSKGTDGVVNSSKPTSKQNSRE